MIARTRCSLAVLLAALLAPPALVTPASAQPTPHHSGAWTPGTLWPASPDTVQGVHLALLRGDTVFSRPHSRILAWGIWDSLSPTRKGGGLYGWRPTTDIGTSAMSNVTKDSAPNPKWLIFCAGAATTPSGDLLVVGGHERDIVGEKRSMRFNWFLRAWESVATMAARRWYANATPLPDGKILATAGNMYDHMTVFGGMRPAGQGLTNTVQRYAVTNAGQWDAPLNGVAPNWPAPREYHTLADQPAGPYFLFGGMAAGNQRRQDVWQLKRKDSDTDESYEWAELFPAAPQGAPVQRWRHAAVVDAGSGPGGGENALNLATMYVFGGDGVSGPLSDLWKLYWDANQATPSWKWQQITPAGAAPDARSGHTAVWDDDGKRMIVFGGQTSAGIVDNDVYVLSFQGSIPRWSVATNVDTTTGKPAPSARTLHAMAWDEKPRNDLRGLLGSSFHAVVYGGQTGPTSLSDELWELFMKPQPDSAGTHEFIWYKRVPLDPTYRPAGRLGAGVVIYDEFPSTVVITGGDTLISGGTDPRSWMIKLGSTYSWEPKAPTGQPVRGHTAFREFRELTMLQPEVYDPTANTWTPVGQKKYQFSYHAMYSASDGGLYYAGPTFSQNPKTYRFNYPGSGTWDEAPTGTYALDSGTGALVRPNLIMKCGDHFGEGAASGGTASFLVDSSTAVWRPSVNSMGLGRRNHTVTMLPTGEAIATGGDNLPHDEDTSTEDSEPRRRPEIWDPMYANPTGRGYWYGANASDAIPLAEGPVARSHHSAAILLPDGRVMTSGGHDTHNIEVKCSVDQFSPPYLYQPGGSPVARPQLFGAQDRIQWGHPFRIACSDPVAEICLVRPGAATHTFNQDQRYVPLTKVGTQVGHKLNAVAPVSAQVAPPGHYLLFVLRNDGGRKVPSLARWVYVGADSTSYDTWDIVPPPAVTNLLVNSNTGNDYLLTWTAPSDAGEGSRGKAWRYEIRWRKNSPITTLDDFFASASVANPPTPLNAGQNHSFTVTGLPARGANETYYFAILSRDAAGSDRNWSEVSNSADWPSTAGGCPFVDVETAAGWTEENSILARSLTGALALDDYRLRATPQVTDGRIRLRVREDEQEVTTLDRVRLIAVDHAPSLLARSIGERVVLGSRLPVHRVLSSTGSDVTALVDGTGGGYTATAGETLFVSLTPSASALVEGALGATGTQPGGGGGFEEGDGGKGGGLTAGDFLRGVSPMAVDALVLGETGIRIEAPDGNGGWRAVRVRYPREHDDECLTDSLTSGEIRLIFQGEHRVGRLSRFVYGGDELAAQKLPLVSAQHSRLGDVMAALDSLGNLTTVVEPGDRVELAFAHPPVPEGLVRDYFLLSHGVYTADLPARPEPVAESPLHFALHGARPNPANEQAVLAFETATESHVRIEVFDVQGRRVAEPVDRRMEAGRHALPWLRRDTAGLRLAGGVYFVRMRAGAFRAEQRVVLSP